MDRRTYQREWARRKASVATEAEREQRRRRDRERYAANLAANREAARAKQSRRRERMTLEERAEQRRASSEEARIRRARAAPTPEQRASRREYSRRYTLLNPPTETDRARSRERAAIQRERHRAAATLVSKGGRRWAPREDVVVATSDLPLIELALVLDRTPGAVANRRNYLKKKETS